MPEQFEHLPDAGKIGSGSNRRMAATPDQAAITPP